MRSGVRSRSFSGPIGWLVGSADHAWRLSKSGRLSAMILSLLPTLLPTDRRMIEEMAWLSQIFACRRRCRSYRRYRTDWSCGCYRADRRDRGYGSRRSRDGHRHRRRAHGQFGCADRCLRGREPRRRRRRLRRWCRPHRRQRVQPPEHLPVGRRRHPGRCRVDESSRLDREILPDEPEQHSVGALRSRLDPAKRRASLA
jgi:hypothetical protein